MQRCLGIEGGRRHGAIRPLQASTEGHVGKQLNELLCFLLVSPIVVPSAEVIGHEGVGEHSGYFAFGKNGSLSLRGCAGVKMANILDTGWEWSNARN